MIRNTVTCGHDARSTDHNIGPLPKDKRNFTFHGSFTWKIKRHTHWPDFKNEKNKLNWENVVNIETVEDKMQKKSLPYN